MAGMVSALAIGMASPFITGGATSAEPGAGVGLPEISITATTADSISIAASVFGLGEAEVTATLLVERRGQGGTASTSQSRDLQLEMGRRDMIAEITISFLPGDRLLVSVTIERDGAIVSTATIATGDGDRPASEPGGDRL